LGDLVIEASIKGGNEMIGNTAISVESTRRGPGHLGKRTGPWRLVKPSRRKSRSTYRVKGVVWIEPEIIPARSAAHAARDYVARHHHDLDANAIVYVWSEEGWTVGDEPFWFSLQ
jgi:hypothetical protein